MRLLCCLALSLLSTLALASEPQRSTQAWTLLDQHDQAFTFIPAEQTLLLATSKDAAKLAHASLQDQPAGFLQAHNLVFLADISRMPNAVAKFIAIPAMQDYRYPVLLDRHARISPRYPVTGPGLEWIEFRNGAIFQQHNFTDTQALNQALQQLTRHD